MIEALASDRSDKSFDVGVRPGRARRRQDFLDADGLHVIERMITIAEEIAGLWNARGGTVVRDNRVPLSDKAMPSIIVLKKVGRRVEEHYKATFAYAPQLLDAIARRCTEVDTGARNIDHILTRTFLPEMPAEFSDA